MQMTEEQIKEINAVYDEAIAKLEVLVTEREGLVKEYYDSINQYIKDLEQKKINALKASITTLETN